MYYDLCVHLDMNDPSLLGLTINNVVNYMAALPDEQYRVRVVVNGPAVQLFRQGSCPQEEKVAEMAAQGVTFAVCANALKAFNVTEAELLPACEVVAAGIVELVRLQREGYAYLRP